MPREIVIDERFQGFSDTALGGYVAGLLAAEFSGPLEISLRGIVRMGRPLGVEQRSPGSVVPSEDGTTLAEGGPAELGVAGPVAGGRRGSGDGVRSVPGVRLPPLPGCFCCGPDRASGDGLRIFPGPVPGRDRLVAAPWIPDSSLAGDDGRVRPEFVWAALDCPQLWSLIVGSPQDSTERVVTAAMATRIDGAVMPGRPHVVMAWPMDRVGRSLFAGGAVATTHGEVIAVSRQRAVALADRGVPLGLDLWHSRAR
jgi:hypothetical protein